MITTRSIHRQCQLDSVASEIAIRFSNAHPPSMYDLEEACRLHGVYWDKLGVEDLTYLVCEIILKSDVNLLEHSFELARQTGKNTAIINRLKILLQEEDKNANATTRTNKS